MIAYLGWRLARAQGKDVAVSYLSRAEGEAVWKTGSLLSIDPQGACFATRAGDGAAGGEEIAECLPWGSIAAIRVAGHEAEAGRSDAEAREDAKPRAKALAAAE